MRSSHFSRRARRTPRAFVPSSPDCGMDPIRLEARYMQSFNRVNPFGDITSTLQVTGNNEVEVQGIPTSDISGSYVTLPYPGSSSSITAIVNNAHNYLDGGGGTTQVEITCALNWKEACDTQNIQGPMEQYVTATANSGPGSLNYTLSGTGSLQYTFNVTFAPIPSTLVGSSASLTIDSTGLDISASFSGGDGGYTTGSVTVNGQLVYTVPPNQTGNAQYTMPTYTTSIPSSWSVSYQSSLETSTTGPSNQQWSTADVELDWTFAATQDTDDVESPIHGRVDHSNEAGSAVADAVKDNRTADALRDAVRPQG
jgi:hypothetical protein